MFRRRTISTPSTVAVLDAVNSTTPSRSAVISGACNNTIRSATLPSNSSILIDQNSAPTSCTTSSPSSLGQEQGIKVYLTQTLPKIRTPPYLSFLTSNNNEFNHHQDKCLGGRVSASKPKQTKFKQKLSKTHKPDQRYQDFLFEVSGQNIFKLSHLDMDNRRDMSMLCNTPTSSNSSKVDTSTTTKSSAENYIKLQYSSMKFRQRQNFEPTTTPLEYKRIVETCQRSAQIHLDPDNTKVRRTAAVNDTSHNHSARLDERSISANKTTETMANLQKEKDLLKTHLSDRQLIER